MATDPTATIIDILPDGTIRPPPPPPRAIGPLGLALMLCAAIALLVLAFSLTVIILPVLLTAIVIAIVIARLRARRAIILRR